MLYENRYGTQNCQAIMSSGGLPKTGKLNQHAVPLLAGIYADIDLASSKRFCRFMTKPVCWT